MFPFNDRVYTWLKWIAAIAFPALTGMVAAILAALQIDIAAVVVAIMAAINTFIGALVGVSNASYYSNKAISEINIALGEDDTDADN